MVDWNKATQQWLHDFAPQGILVTDAELNIRGWNNWLETHSGRRAADVMGRNLLEVYPELVERGLDRYYREALAGQVWILSQRFHRYLLPMPSAYRSGPELMTQSAHIAPLVQEERVIGAITVIEDVTERVWAEERMTHLNLVLRATRRVNQLITREGDRDRLLQSTCDMLIETRGYLHAWIALLDESGELVTAAEASWGKDFAPLVEQLKRGELPPCGQRALGQSEVVITKDPLSACAGCPLSAKLEGLGTMTARLEHGGEVYGLLTISIPPDLVVDEEEHALLDEVAGDIAFALHSIELEEERQRTEEALAESERRYRSLFENIPEIVYALSTEGRFTLLNPAFERLTGWSVQEWLGKPFGELVHPEDREMARREFGRALKGETRDFREMRIVTKAGETWVMEVLGVAQVQDGQVVGVTGFAHDVTERKRAEEALRESEAKWRSLVENAPDIILTVDRDDKILFINRVPVGLTAEESLGTNALDYVAPEHRETVRQSLQRVFETGEPDHYEIAARGPHDANSWYTTRLGPIKRDGEVVAAILITRDITERKRAEEALRQSFEKLQKTLEGTVNVLVSTIEIKDPYTAGHQRRVAQLACAIAREMGLPQEEMAALRMAGLIHDIGKISIPAEVLSKPVQLNDIEWSMIKAHPKVGYNILKTVDFPWLVAQIVLEHHERLDGSGYPQGLSSTGILMKARILAVADVVEAMASHRPYRPARGLDKALEEISQNRGILYDPEVVDVCLKLFAEKKFEFD